jgi:hypothetical protein
MKRLFIAITCYLVLYTSAAVAQTTQRDRLIDKVGACYVQGTMLSEDSPLIDMLLAPAKSANPSVVSGTWLEIKKEIASGISKAMTEKGGLIDLLLRKSVEKLSDGELDHLDRILCDPVYTKFQTAMASPSTQKQLAQALFANTLKFNVVINSVLMRHGLKEVQ